MAVSSNAAINAEGEHATSRKRRRPSRMGGAYARKRAVIACEVCRFRKTKCDNVRPTCGFCASNGAKCVFADQQTNYAEFDPASLAILDRVNYAIHLLESPSGLQNSAPDLTRTSATSPGDRIRESKAETDTDAFDVNTLCSCVHVLQWPIFEGLVSPSSIGQALIDSELRPLPGSTPGADLSDRVEKRANVDVEDIEQLVERFLRNVHIKNPILDPAAILGLARNVAEEGFGWDSTSCLVLIACALGSLSTSWQVAVPSGSETSLDEALDHSIAEAYYKAAQKRAGVLGLGLESAQCWFLTGIYEMYSMRPMRGWASFVRACNLTEAHLCLQGLAGVQDLGSAEQRLSWSCLKSETELREEFDLASPGLARLGHRTDLPSPPRAGQTPDELGHGFDEALQALHEQSWYYYLSDIAHRQIAYRVQTLLYSEPKESWLHMPVRQLQLITKELDAQVIQWWTNLPGSPSPPIQPDTDELTYMIYLNYADTRERIWRPLLYIAIHGDFSEVDDATVIVGAEKCLQLSFEMLDNARLKHRHHGCWQTVRCMFTKALLILAAVRSRRMDIRSDWREHVLDFQSYLRYWQDEAADLRAANQALTVLMETIG